MARDDYFVISAKILELESTLEKEYNLTMAEAHKKAKKQFDWEKALVDAVGGMVNNLVYCDYKENTVDTVTYLYGGDYEDITGVIIFRFNDDVIEIVKEPDLEPAPMRHIKRLYGAQRENFKKGIFKKKISYES